MIGAKLAKTWVLLAALLMCAGQVAPVSAAPARPTASLTGCNPAPLPGLCVGRAATTQEEADMIAVGKRGIEAELGLADSTNCTPDKNCFIIGTPSRAMVGTSAGTLYGIRTDNGTVHKAGCYVFLHQDAAGWHYDNGRCVTAVEQVPSAVSQVYSGSCVNIRDAPSTSGRVLECVQPGARVYIDSAPTYASGHIWWHLLCLGWMAHDFLVIPLGQTNRAADVDIAPDCPAPQPPYNPIISLSLDSGGLDSNLVLVASGFPPGESATAYWKNRYPVLLGSPTIDPKGHFEADAEHGGGPNGVSFFLLNTQGTFPSGSDEVCADAQAPGVKACAAFTVEGTTPSPPPSITSPARSVQPAASVGTLPTILFGVGLASLLLVALSGVIWWRSRRR